MCDLVSFAATPPRISTGSGWYPFRGATLRPGQLTFYGSVVRVLTPIGLSTDAVLPLSPPAAWTRSVEEDGRTVRFVKTSPAASFVELFRAVEIDTSSSDPDVTLATQLQITASEPFSANINVFNFASAPSPAAYVDGSAITLAFPYQTAVRLYTIDASLNAPTEGLIVEGSQAAQVNFAVQRTSWGYVFSRSSSATEDQVVVVNESGQIGVSSVTCVEFLALEVDATTLLLYSIGDATDTFEVFTQEFTDLGASVSVGPISADPSPPLLPATYLRRNMTRVFGSNRAILMGSPTTLYTIDYVSSTRTDLTSLDISGDLIGGDILSFKFVTQNFPTFSITLFLVFATTGIFTYDYIGGTFVLKGRSTLPPAQVPLELQNVTVIAVSAGSIVTSCDAVGTVTYNGTDYYYVRIRFSGATLENPATVTFEPFTEFPSGPFPAEQVNVSGTSGNAGFRLPATDNLVGIVSTFEGLQATVAYDAVQNRIGALLSGDGSVDTLDESFPAMQGTLYSGFLPPSSLRFTGSSLLAGTETGWTFTEETGNVIVATRTSSASTSLLPSVGVVVKEGGTFSVESRSDTFSLTADRAVTNVCMAPGQDAVAWQTSNGDIFVAKLPNLVGSMTPTFRGIGSLNFVLSERYIVVNYVVYDIVTKLPLPSDVSYNTPVLIAPVDGNSFVMVEEVETARFVLRTVRVGPSTSEVSITDTDLEMPDAIQDSLSATGMSGIHFYFTDDLSSDEFVQEVPLFPLYTEAWERTGDDRHLLRLSEGATPPSGTLYGFLVSDAPVPMRLTSVGLFQLVSGSWTQVGGAVPIPSGKTPRGALYVSDTKFIAAFSDELRTMTLSDGTWTASAPDPRFSGATDVSMNGICAWSDSTIVILQREQTSEAFQRTVHFASPDPSPTATPTATPTAVPTATATATPAKSKTSSSILTNTAAITVLTLLAACVVALVVLSALLANK